MDFFDKVGETVYNTGKTISDKAKEMAAIAELKNLLNIEPSIISPFGATGKPKASANPLFTVFCFLILLNCLRE